MKAKIVPTIIFIVMVFTYLIGGEQAATAQQPKEVEQNVYHIVDSLACEVDGICYAILHPEDSIYSPEFIDEWREELEIGIQEVVISHQLTPKELFIIMQPMYEMNINHGYSMDMDCAISLWSHYPKRYVKKFWKEYHNLRNEYYQKNK